MYFAVLSSSISALATSCLSSRTIRKIGANLIHITEKYFHAKALHGVAVIISPKGFSDPAKRAVHGALRDVNKLMLDLDVSLLCKLLEAKDLAQQPDVEMKRLIDTFLLAVGR